MELRFDFASDDRSAGFRLEDFELFNWGTYDKKIVHLNLNKYNALLTGDIGSGKSTIVDALTTLIVPHNKITFNKAAGANTKERTLHSYIVGEYKSTQDENFGHSKAVSLRDESSFTVILGRFENIGYDESITLAQFFYIAYTVLASSLAYQFGLEHNKIQSRSFRFVMIDEAFGRGSDESTKYALRLFEKLKLQLLVITPKQKINVIEPYVNSVHFVHNQDGMDSSLISMKIEEYIKNKKK